MGKSRFYTFFWERIENKFAFHEHIPLETYNVTSDGIPVKGAIDVDLFLTSWEKNSTKEEIETAMEVFDKLLQEGNDDKTVQFLFDMCSED